MLGIGGGQDSRVQKYNIDRNRRINHGSNIPLQSATLVYLLIIIFPLCEHRAKTVTHGNVSAVSFKLAAVNW